MPGGLFVTQLLAKPLFFSPIIALRLDRLSAIVGTAQHVFFGLPHFAIVRLRDNMVSHTRFPGAEETPTKQKTNQYHNLDASQTAPQNKSIR